jgi:hypothetical protein
VAIEKVTAEVSAAEVVTFLNEMVAAKHAASHRFSERFLELALFD